MQETHFIKILGEQRDNFRKELRELQQQHEGQLKAFQNSTMKDYKTALQQFIHDLKAKHSHPPTKTTPMKHVAQKMPTISHHMQNSQSFDNHQLPSRVTMMETPNINIYDTRIVDFIYKGEVLVQDDKEFSKNAPKLIPPVSEDNGLTLYSQVQHNARIYNIMVTDIEDVTVWNMAPESNPPLMQLVVWI